MLAIWYGVAPEVADDFDAWMTREHMPERLAVPGFRHGRRYRELHRDRYLTLYDLDDVDVLTSPAYRDRAADPTPWTERMLPQFRDLVRVGYRVVASFGAGFGGTIATLPLPEELDAAAERVVADEPRLAAVRVLAAVEGPERLALVEGLDAAAVDAAAGALGGTGASHYRLIHALSNDHGG